MDETTKEIGQGNLPLKTKRLKNTSDKVETTS